jgi:hypothetical protein
MKDALGHGSNARGTHAQGIEKLGVRLHPNVLTTVNKNPGGFSVKPKTGKMPTSGYMVSIPGHTKIVSEADLKGPRGAALLAQYAREHADVLQQPGAHIGGWTDKATAKTYLDVSHNVKGRSAAISTGKKHNQIAIWDVKHGREINTGGSGK